MEKSISLFHRQGTGKRHSWCKDCYNAWNRERRRGKKRTPGSDRGRNLKARYGMEQWVYDLMLSHQSNRCAICEGAMSRPVVDHDHKTGVVRGLLCHRCNVALGYVEDRDWLARAQAYLNRSISLPPGSRVRIFQLPDGGLGYSESALRSSSKSRGSFAK